MNFLYYVRNGLFKLYDAIRKIYLIDVYFMFIRSKLTRFKPNKACGEVTNCDFTKLFSFLKFPSFKFSIFAAINTKKEAILVLEL